MLDKHLEILEDTTFTHYAPRNQHFEAILHVLDKGNNPGVSKLERVLTVCVHDLKEDVRHAVFCLNIITKIVNKHQTELSTSTLSLSAEAVLNLLLTAASLNRAESLQTISFNTLLAYPDNVLAELASECNDFYELFNLYCHLKMPVEIRFKPVNLAHRVMTSLTPEKKSTFVKKGLAVWFSKVIPTAMNYFQIQTLGTIPMVLSIMELLEMLTEELASIDYSSNPQWQTVLEYIYSPNAYPAQMKNLLTSGSILWHRLWIIFIKLLKAQITMNKPGVGSPINSMLPVVEMAFKMDVKSRCRAFKCWNVLIDNFSAETNELFVNKRIKLLIIPLRSNNAKVEETALAKLDTWWHLINQYETRVDERMLYPFLHFCFGRHIPEKTALIPGMISPIVKKNCVEAFVEMVGHVNCEGCVSKPRLKGKLISPKVLVDHWSDWTHSLKMAIKVSAEDEVGIAKQPIMCAWKSFVTTIAEMPENNIRKDLFNDLLTTIKLLAQESASNNKLADIVNSVISSLLEENSWKQLLKTKEFQSGPIQVIFSILTDATFAETCKMHSNQSLLLNLKLLTEFLVMECGNLVEKAIKWLMKDITPNDSSLQLWTALAEALQDSQTRHECLQQMCNLLLWPLLNLEYFSDVKTAALTWNSTYCVMHLTTVQTVWFHMEIDRILTENENKGATVRFFVLCVLLAVIKNKITTRTYEGINKEIKILHDVICKYNEYDEVKPVFPILIDTVDLLSTAATNERLVGDYIQEIFVIGRKSLNILLKHIKIGDSTGEVLLVKVIDAFEHLFKTEKGNEFKVILLDELLECRTLFTNIPANLDAMLKLIMADESIDESLKAKIRLAFNKSEVQGLKNKVPKTKDQDESKFTTPVTKSTKMEPKKKEASIVNTVVENGEEFAVIKSNWKFNPRKLTENQKEKFKRKREDIPALYQDLSQSQDEFKLKSWKTDSQDASTTNSRSISTPSNDNISTIKNMPGTDIVPKIIDNFFSDSPKSTEKNENKQTDSPKQSKVDQTKPSPGVKTPRMALKDRVFRNVRNLIEKSTVPEEGAQKVDLLNQTVNANTCITPITKCKETVVNSAPSKINADRPARVKRKPKKFDDSEIYLEKKRRNSATQNDSQSLDKNNASENVTNIIDKNNEYVNNTLKAGTVSVSNMEIDTIRVCNSDVSINDHKNENDIEKVDAEKTKAEAEVSPAPIEKPVDKSDDKDNDASHANLEDNVKCSQGDTSIDKSLEDTQQPKAKEDTPGGDNTSTPKNISKKKDSDRAKSTTKKKSRIEKELPDDDASHANLEDNVKCSQGDTSIDKSLEDTQKPETKDIPGGDNTSTPKHIFKKKDSDGTKSTTKKNSSIEKEPPDDDASHDNLQDNVKCSQEDTSIDKSIEETQQPETKDIPGGDNISTPKNILKRKDSDGTKSTTKKKSRIEKELPDDDASHDNLQDNVKCSQEDTSINKSIEETETMDTPGGTNISTAKNILKKKDSDGAKSTTKKKSRIEKELAIDMVEGHPFLNQQSEKRVTRKGLTDSPVGGRKMRLADKLNKSKTEPRSASKHKKVTSNTEALKEKTRKNINEIVKSPVTVCESQDISPNATQDLSEDFIESSQDTTTTISVKSFRSCANKPSSSSESIDNTVLETQDLFDKSSQKINKTTDIIMSQEKKDDTELPANKTAIQENVIMDLTEEMDTEPTSSGDVIIINDDDPIVDLNTECDPGPGPDTLELANADTQPTDPSQFVTNASVSMETSHNVIPDTKDNNKKAKSRVDESLLTADDRTITLVDITQNEDTGASSPTIDSDQRKKDFLNNTSEISPIKALSPIEPKSPASETSSDFLVIKLSGPVQINGEPLEMTNSPEIFTEEKISPDKRDQSPPRPEVTVSKSSPSSSLSLKKNRPQVRSGGRAAQMLGLCVLDRLQTIKHVDRPDTDEPKKSSPVTTPARRNLRMLYQTAQSADSGSSDEKEDIENFLKFKKTLPSAECSPSGPILKRKLADIADEATVSPANKRKRVSFHDPVSTSVSVQKYIETCGVRSPQNSALKRLERQLRHQSPKSSKRLASSVEFKLDSILTKAVESFSEDPMASNDTELSSLDQTPAAEIVKTSELNDTDPIFPDLVNCKDSIDTIALELSSPGMKLLLVKELEGKIETVGDLAKLTELEVNRICIKAPKVQVARKVLADYASKKDKNMKVDTLVEPTANVNLTTSVDRSRKDELMEVDKEMEPTITVDLTVTSDERSEKGEAIADDTFSDLAKLTELEVTKIDGKTKPQLTKKQLDDSASGEDKVLEVEKTVDLTNDTELEMNRIDAPKAQVTKKSSGPRREKIMEANKVTQPNVNVNLTVATSVGIQTNILMSETETQTSLILQRLTSTQTDEIMTAQTGSQTSESGSKSTEEIITSCIQDREDFILKLGDQLENASKLQLAEYLPLEDCTDLLVKKMTSLDANTVLNSVLQRGCDLHTNGQNGNKELSYLQNYLCDKFDVKDLILFCSQMMQKVYDKSIVDKNI